MANPDPHKDEHIEDLLSQLQGIFGRLSQSEQEESKQTVETPAPQKETKSAPQTPPPVEARPPIHTREPEPTAPPDPTPFEATPASAPESIPIVEPIPPPAPVPPATPQAAPVAQVTGAYESSVPFAPEDSTVIPTAVFYTVGREGEAKSLAQKLETMTPKFTKVAFRLRVGVFMPFDPKSEWKEGLITQAQNSGLQTVFLLTERPLEEARRKVVVSDLETLGIYFHEVPVSSVEKKAFYTDILLGLVFFFDSRKPSGGESA